MKLAPLFAEQLDPCAPTPDCSLRYHAGQVECPLLDARTHALESAILFRKCAERLRVSKPMGAVCRTLMREQALQWRRLAPLPVAVVSPV